VYSLRHVAVRSQGSDALPRWARARPRSGPTARASPRRGIAGGAPGTNAVLESNGPWTVVQPVHLPTPILRVPVRYYHVRPAQWHAWRHDAPPRWDGHWVFTHAPGVGGVKTSGGGVTNFNVSRKNFNIGTHYDHFGRDFRVNDIGFFRTRANRNQAEGYAEVGQPDPWKIFRRFWGFSSYGYGWTDERLNINDYLETGVSFQFLNYWNFNFGGGRQGDVYDDLDTGPG